MSRELTREEKAAIRSHIYAVALWDNLSRSARFLRRCYFGKQSRLCDPAVCFV